MGLGSMAKSVFLPTSKKDLQKPADKIFGIDSAKKAAKEQAELTDKALNEYGQFTDSKYADMQRNITTRLGKGRAADIDEEAFQKNVVDPATQNYNQKTIPGINQGFRNNYYSMSRQNAQADAANDLYSKIGAARQEEQANASNRQQSALATLQNAAQNRANINVGAAANVQAMPSGMQMLNDAANTAKNARGAYAAGKMAYGTEDGSGGKYSGDMGWSSSPYNKG